MGIPGRPPRTISAPDLASRIGEVGGGDGRRPTVDVEVVLSKDLGSLVDGVTRSVEDSALHVLRDGQLHGRSRELDVGRLDVDARRALEDLDDGLLALDLEDLTSSLGAIGQSESDDLVVRRELRSGRGRRRHVSKEPVKGRVARREGVKGAQEKR